uniref:Uncharacterized protein n=1 Tax=Cannabis sativa TaxID=3483 RepID=A0A803QSE8_CANSA
YRDLSGYYGPSTPWSSDNSPPSDFGKSLSFEDIMDRRRKKRGTEPGVPTTSEVVPPKKHKKTTVHSKKFWSKPIDLEVSDDETQEQVPLSVALNTNAPPLETAHASASTSRVIETLLAAAEEVGSEFAK